MGTASRRASSIFAQCDLSVLRERGVGTSYQSVPAFGSRTIAGPSFLPASGSALCQLAIVGSDPADQRHRQHILCSQTLEPADAVVPGAFMVFIRRGAATSLSYLSLSSISVTQSPPHTAQLIHTTRTSQRSSWDQASMPGVTLNQQPPPTSRPHCLRCFG